MIRACLAVGLSRSTAYRQCRPRRAAVARPRRSHRKLTEPEAQQLYEVLDSKRFLDQPPREVYATLLSEGRHLGSVSTMYRYLHQRGPLRDRRDHRQRVQHPVPRLEAVAPCQVWSWDISKLATVAKGTFLSLYVILDLYSRYVVAWMVAEHENSALAKQLFAEAISRYRVEPGRLIVHQDRGAPMTSHGFADLLGELGVDRSYSRPRVSNDNAMSEAHFHTLKYQPDYPGRFQDIHHARRWCRDFFAWYNDHHHHEGLALFTPADVFFGRVDAVAAVRQAALLDAYKAHPERFKKEPELPRPPLVVRLNPPEHGAPTITGADVLDATEPQLAAMLSTAPKPIPIAAINLPGAPPPAAFPT